MGRLNYIRLALLLFISTVTHQASFAQLNQKGAIISSYVGTDWYALLYRANYPDTLNEDGQRFQVNNVSSSGSWGFKLEQMITRKFGVTFDFWYAQTSVSATCIQLYGSDYPYDTLGNYIPYSQRHWEERAEFSKKLSRLNATLRFDLHFGRSDKIDPYVFTALGGAFYKQYFSSSNIDIYSEDTYYFPLSFKIGGGFRYFPWQNVGIFTELAIGGPIVSGGICYKFYKMEKWIQKD